MINLDSGRFKIVAVTRFCDRIRMFGAAAKFYVSKGLLKTWIR